MYNGTKVKLNTIEKVNRFTGITMKFTSDIDVSIGEHIVNGKSALGILTFDLRKPLNVTIHSDDEEEIRRFYNAMVEFE